MIRVVVGPSREGRFDYTVETTETRLAGPLRGLSATPLFDACRRLKELGAASDDAMVGMFNSLDEPDNRFRLRTTVGYGAKMTVGTSNSGGVVFKRRPTDAPGALGEEKDAGGTEMTPEAGEPVLGPARAQEMAFGVETTGAKSAISAAAPPPRSTPPASPAGTGPVPTKQPKRGLMHRKRKRAGSSGRRGQR